MASKIYYYVNNDKRTVTAVIYGTVRDALNKITTILKNTKNVNILFNHYIFYSMIGKYEDGDTFLNKDDNVYYRRDDKISSTITAEPDAVFDKDTIERLKYIAKCSVKNKCYNRLEKIYFMYTEILDRMCNVIETNLIKKNQYILKTRPFKYVDPEDWDKVKKNRARNRLDEI